MWGNLAKNAQALASIAAEQAQKGIASANQLLEKLDGQMEGDEDADDGEDDEGGDDQETGSLDNTGKKIIAAGPDNNESNASEVDVSDNRDLKGSDHKIHTSGGEEMASNPMNQPNKFLLSQSFDVNPADNLIDDELDQLLLDDDAADSSKDDKSSLDGRRHQKEELGEAVAPNATSSTIIGDSYQAVAAVPHDENKNLRSDDEPSSGIKLPTQVSLTKCLRDQISSFLTHIAYIISGYITYQ